MDPEERKEERMESESVSGDSGSSGEESAISCGEEDGSGSDWESSEESGDETEPVENRPGTSNSASSASADVGNAISESDGESEKCPICLLRFEDDGGLIGTPETCDHDFCLECIQEWAKKTNTCPLDRHIFHIILAKQGTEGTVYKKIAVGDKQQEVEGDLPGVEDMTTCEVCGQSNREDRLLLCDGCDLAYHCECLNVPLANVPHGDWFCERCAPPARRPNRRAARANVIVINSDEEEAEEVDETVIVNGPRNRNVGRTLVLERVRAAIAQARQGRDVLRGLNTRPRLSTDDEDYSMPSDNEDTAVTCPKTTATTKRKTTTKKPAKKKKRKTKRKTTKKKKTTTSKTTSSTSGTTTKKKRKKKRKTKKKKSAPTKKATHKNPKKHIANVLGMKKPLGSSIPTVRVGNHSSLEDMRSSIGVNRLSIFGNRDDFEPMASSDEENHRLGSGGGSGGDVAVARAPVHRHGPQLSKAALAARRPIPNRAPSRLHAQPTSFSGGSFDLLGSIMAGQQILNIAPEHITIRRDGSLQAELPKDTSTKKAPRNGLVKNPSFKRSTTGSEPKDGDDDNTAGNGQNNQSGGDRNSQQQQQQQGALVADKGERVAQEDGGNVAGSGDGMGDGDDDHLFNSGDLCIDSGADNGSQDEGEEEKEKEEKSPTKDEEDSEEKKEPEIYDPEHATASDDEASEPKAPDLYDPMEATESPALSPSSNINDPAVPETVVISPIEQNEDEASANPQESELYDPLEATATDEEEGEKEETKPQEEGESEVTDSNVAIPEDNNDNDEDSAQNITKASSSRDSVVDEDSQNVVSAAISPEKLDLTQVSQSQLSTSQDYASELQVSCESPASVLKEQSENAQMSPIVITQPIVITPDAPQVDPNTGEEAPPVIEGMTNAEGEVDSELDEDCPTPVADENGPESPDPETQNPENFAFSRNLNTSDDLNLSDDNSLTGTPAPNTNDVTPNLSPISNSEIPLTKHGAQTPEHDTLSKASFPAGGEWEVKESEGLTDSEEEEFRQRFLPVSDLPRIPKKKPQAEVPVIVIDDEDSPEEHHRSVLEKVNVKDDSYRWEGGKRHRERSSRERRRRTRSPDSDDKTQRRRRHNRGDDDSEDGARKERKKKRHRKSRSRSRNRSRDLKARRSRSREKRRARKSRSRSRHRRKSRSRDRERRRHAGSRGSRSRTPKRGKDKHRDRDRSREKKKRERERRSPSRDRFGRSVPSEYKASIKTFTQAIKDVSGTDSNRKFKLKRNFYNEGDGDSSADDRMPSPPPKKKKSDEKSRREKDREDRGGWRTPSPQPEQKIETVISRHSSRPKEPPVFERNKDYDDSDSDSSLASDAGEKTAIPSGASNSNNIAIRTEDKSPPRLYSNYDPSDPTEAASPPQHSEEKDKNAIPGLGSPHHTSASQIPATSSLMFTGSPLTLDPLRNSAATGIRDPPPGLFNPENPIRPGGVMLRPPLGLVGPGGQVMVNPLMGPPPGFNPQFPPPTSGAPRVPAPGNFIQLPGGQRIPVSQNGGLMEGLSASGGLRLPDTRLPPPSTSGASRVSQPDLPAKALEQMQQISNLLNAQAKLAQFVPGGGNQQQGAGKESQGESQVPTQVGGILGSHSRGLKPFDKQTTGPFKVPMPPPPVSKDNGGESGNKKGKKEDNEVVDMDVASPYSDDEVGINISFSPPLKKRSRRSDSKKSNNQQNTSDSLEAKNNDVFGKQQKTTTISRSSKKKEKQINVKFNLEKKPSALVKPSKAAVSKTSAAADDVPTSAVELDKQQKYLKKMNRQERVVEEVKLAIKPHYAAGKINKNDYKEIMRKCVPKICHSKNQDINPEKIRQYVLAYVNKTRQLHKYEQKKVLQVKGGGAASNNKQKK